MADRNTIFGWVLGAGIVALGMGSLTSHLWHAEELEKQGYAVAEAEGTGGGAAVAGPSIETLMQTADAAAGAAIFAKCAACHNVAQGGANGIGPNLYGVVGQGVAARAGYAFSDALKSHGGNWDFANLNAWLESPRRFANGTKMSFAGLSNPQERANLIAYLNQQGSNLPMPAAPAPAAAEGDDAAEAGANAAAAGNAAAPATAGANAAAAPTAAPAAAN